MSIPPQTPDLSGLKRAIQATWTTGDFGQIARFAAKSSAEFVNRLGIEPGARVLDVACGTGNLAIPAAVAGARVTGVDIAPNLLEQARQRAAAAGVKADFLEGDAEQLPFPENEFDLAMSMFGAMFAPRPQLAAAELVRVCRPGGRIAMANWTPAGFTGQLFSINARYLPPPAGIMNPLLWGDPAVVRERFSTHGVAIETSLHHIHFDFPFPPVQVVQFFRDFFGPTTTAFARLDPAGQQAYAADLEELWSRHNTAGDGSTSIAQEYLQVVGLVS